MINHLQLLDLYHSPEILIFVVGIFWLILGKLRLHIYKLCSLIMFNTAHSVCPKAWLLRILEELKNPKF